MVLLLDKNEELNQANILKAILDKRSVVVFSDGEMIGPRDYADCLGILTLDRVCLEDEFAQAADISASVEGEDLLVTVKNNGNKKLKGKLFFDVSKELTIGNNVRQKTLSVARGKQKTIKLPVKYTSKTVGRINPIAVAFDWGQNSWSTVTYLRVPSPVEVHHMMLVDEEKFSFPITLWNCGNKPKVNVEIEIFEESKSKPVLSKTVSVNAPHAEETTFEEEFSLRQGQYSVKVSALDHTAQSQISVRKINTAASTHLEDLNNDGITEIVMENDLIRATILLTGGRVIEYILKSQQDNLLFKLWPEKPPLDAKPGGKRRFYPYGGLEEFIGQPTIETHIQFKYEILKAAGPYVSVKVWANIHGNLIEKIITLRDDSTVLEVK